MKGKRKNLAHCILAAVLTVALLAGCVMNPELTAVKAAGTVDFTVIAEETDLTQPLEVTVGDTLELGQYFTVTPEDADVTYGLSGEGASCAEVENSTLKIAEELDTEADSLELKVTASVGEGTGENQRAELSVKIIKEDAVSDPGKITMVYGETKAAADAGITLSKKNSLSVTKGGEIITIDKDNNITATGVGEATITVKSGKYSDKDYDIKVNPYQLDLSGKTLTIPYGDTWQWELDGISGEMVIVTAKENGSGISRKEAGECTSYDGITFAVVDDNYEISGKPQKIVVEPRPIQVKPVPADGKNAAIPYFSADVKSLVSWEIDGTDAETEKLRELLESDKVQVDGEVFVYYAENNGSEVVLSDEKPLVLPIADSYKLKLRFGEKAEPDAGFGLLDTDITDTEDKCGNYRLVFKEAAAFEFSVTEAALEESEYGFEKVKNQESLPDEETELYIEISGDGETRTRKLWYDGSGFAVTAAQQDKYTEVQYEGTDGQWKTLSGYALESDQSEAELKIRLAKVEGGKTVAWSSVHTWMVYKDGAAPMVSLTDVKKADGAFDKLNSSEWLSTAPSWQEDMKKLYDAFGDSIQSAVLTARDGTEASASGLKAAAYVWINAADISAAPGEEPDWEAFLTAPGMESWTEIEFEGKTAEKVLEQKVPGYWVLAVRAEDQVGHVAYYLSNGIVIDTALNSSVTMYLVENEQTSLYNSGENGHAGLVRIYGGDIALQFAVEHETEDVPASPVRSIVCTAYNMGFADPVIDGAYGAWIAANGETAQKQVLVSWPGEDESLTEIYSEEELLNRVELNAMIPAETFNSNHILVEVKVTDATGNKDCSYYKFAIDTTDPVIEVVYDNHSVKNQSYYDAPRTAVVTVTERNFDESAVQLLWTNTDSAAPAVSGWSHSADAGESDSTVHTATVIFHADGDYTLLVKAADLAGNAAADVRVEEFTIDKTLPVVTVSYDNNSASNGYYYNKARTATITIREHNFNASDVQVTVTAHNRGNAQAAPSISSFGGSGDSHTASIVYNKDMDYTFTISYTDLAGNVMEAYQTDSFTVDLTNPAIAISGVKEATAYKGTVAPVITLEDTNFEADGVTVFLKGAKNGVVKSFKYSVADNSFGQTITYADFKHTELVDDIYTLTVKAVDKAGNEYQTERHFSVNRHGSNYTMDPGVIKLLEQYYVNQAGMDSIGNLKITEINVVGLKPVRITVSHDGEVRELVKGTDYTEAESHDAAGWTVLNYEIFKKNFEAEGKYAVTIYSTDVAGNTTDNEVKKNAIEFVVDKTAPTVIFGNLTDRGTYREENHTYSIAVMDNIGVAGVEVFVDGEKIGAFTKEQLAAGRAEFTLESSNNWQTIQAAAYDYAGNEINTADQQNYRVLVSASLWVQFCHNTPLVIGSVILLLVLIGACILFVAKRRKTRS